MDIINTTAVKDTDIIEVRNLTDSFVGYITMEGVRRVFPAKAVMKVEAKELRSLNYDFGGHVLLTEYLHVDNPELAKEFGISEDAVEYNWTIEDIKRALTTDPIEVLLDALDFAPEGIKSTIVDQAVELEIKDVSKREAIKEALGYDITAMINNKHKSEEASSEETSASTRRVATPTKQRRVVKKKKEE